MDYIARANQYISDVLAGKIAACKWVKLACERQKRDLERRDSRYYFDHDRASRICRFIELLPHIKGEWARGGKLITLEPWQCFILTTVFGWIDGNGHRRFKTVYIECPRKNAKSTLSSGVALYLLAADGEMGAEVYSAATTRDQARIVFNDAKGMAERSPGLRAHFGVETAAHSVYVPRNASKFGTLARDQGGNLDGLNVYCAIVDELHGHKTRDVWDVLETATGARRQPLLWAITTAGFNRVGICYEQRTYLTKLLDGVMQDDEYFGVIYSIDETDDPWAESSWIKANPNWGISVNPDDIRRKARKAMEMAAAQNNFLTKHLNVWVNADTAWMNMQAWEKAGNPDLAPDDFEGQPCWMGLDLATKTDLAALALLFKPNDGEYVAFVRFFLPEEAAEDGRNAHYAGWSIEERLTLTPGNTLDFAYIENEIRDLARRFDIQEVAFDPWQANYLATRLMDEGLKMVEVRQLVQHMSPAMKELEAAVLSGRFHHAACPVLTWNISNVVGHLDAKDNIYPRKEQPQNKIDGVIALLMALSRAMTVNAGPSVYEERGLVLL